MELLVFDRQPQKAQRLQKERYLIMLIPLHIYRHTAHHNHHSQRILHLILAFIINLRIILRIENLPPNVDTRIVSLIRCAIRIDVNPVLKCPPCRGIRVVSHTVANQQKSDRFSEVVCEDDLALLFSLALVAVP
jgi:hypothetical protein